MLHPNTCSIAIDFAGFVFRPARARSFGSPPEGRRTSGRIAPRAALAALQQRAYTPGILSPGRFV